MITITQTVAQFMDASYAIKLASMLHQNDELIKDVCRTFVALYHELRVVRETVDALYNRETYKDLYDALDYLDEIYNRKNGMS